MAGADDSYESAALPVLEDGGIRFERFVGPGLRQALAADQSSMECRGAFTNPFPAFLPRAAGARRSLMHSSNPVANIIANRMDGTTVNGASVFKADIYVFAPGPWLGRVFSRCWLSSSFDL